MTVLTTAITENAFGPLLLGPETSWVRVLARVIFRFNLEACEEDSNWDYQRAFVLWEKKPLRCRLTVVIPTLRQ